MLVGVMFASAAAFVVLGFVLLGGPMFIASWHRKRREQEIERQIALTDAMDGKMGPIVAPFVTKPLFGPWQIQIAVPVHQSVVVARILSVVDAVFSNVEGVASHPYQVVLTAQADLRRKAHTTRTHRSATGWTRHPIGAA